MKYKLGGQRPLDIRDVRAKKTPSLVGTFFVLPLLLLVAGLLVHAAWQFWAAYRASGEVPGLALAVAVGLASAVVALVAATILPGPTPDRPS